MAFLREVTEFYEDRVKLPKSCSCANHNILFFIEDATHFSDQGFGYSYMIWSKDKNANMIRLCPTDTRYADYSFLVNTSICSIEAASYIIWRYFACKICNKRQCFQLGAIFKLFGIESIKKIRQDGLVVISIA